MSGGGGGGSRNGKKSLDFDLNLTSFIDLLSTCTCFLLISAVWVQIGTVEIKQSHGTDAPAVAKNSFDLDLVFKSPSEIKISMKKDGKQVKTLDVKSVNPEALAKELNAALVSQILKTNDKNSQKIEIAVATVTPKSTVNYGQLVSALDVLRKNQIVNIGVQTARGQ